MVCISFAVSRLEPCRPPAVQDPGGRHPEQGTWRRGRGVDPRAHGKKRSVGCVSQLWDLNRPLKSRLGNKGPVGHTLGAPVLCKRHGAPNCVFERLHIREDFFFFFLKRSGDREERVVVLECETSSRLPRIRVCQGWVKSCPLRSL